MKAVILAAGQGTRIRSVHGERPKCLIPVGDQTILDCQLDALSMAGVREVAIVVGYKKEQIIDHVRFRRNHVGPNVHFIQNPAFGLTNNIYSLWVAREWLRDDSFVCLNADVIFDAEILVSALQGTASISMIVDPEWRDETMKVIIRDGLVVRMSKKIPRDQFHGTYIGITTFRRPIQEEFFGKMEELVGAGRVNEFFNAAVQELADEGVSVGFTTTDGLVWAEIDDPLDLTFAQQKVFPQLATGLPPAAEAFSQLNIASY
ncbi:MAG: phosphocholine cytidylyltransferase family protein [Silvibacterium sp.]|nr:phosphocholine cytidylyltransferase family protein [Silvibacterium sp.]